MYLVILHPDNKSYKRMRLNKLDDEVADMIEARRRAVAEGCKQSVILPLPVAHADADTDECSDTEVNRGCMIRL